LLRGRLVLGFDVVDHRGAWRRCPHRSDRGYFVGEPNMINGTMFTGLTNFVLLFIISFAETHGINISGLNPQLAVNLLSFILQTA
jgi:hypothetical protein